MIIRRKRVSFLRRMEALLDRAELIYGSYMKSGKLFLYAKALRDCNEEIRTCVSVNAHLLPRSYRVDALALINHLNVWIALWDEAFERVRPEPWCVFYFDNHVNFPQKEVARLVSLVGEFK